MIAAGNSVVFNVHPGREGRVQPPDGLLNDAIVGAGGPRNCLCAVASPDDRKRRRADAARRSVPPGRDRRAGSGEGSHGERQEGHLRRPGQSAVRRGPTADLAKAGRDIVAGASFDNNVVCICEKEVLAVEAIADRLKAGDAGQRAPSSCPAAQIEAVTRLVIAVPRAPRVESAPNKDMVGKDAAVIARAAGIEVPAGDAAAAHGGRPRSTRWCGASS